MIDRNVRLQVYTTIINGECGQKGSDPIRVAVIKRLVNGVTKPAIGGVGSVNRTENWRENLKIRIDNATHLYQTIQELYA